MLNIAKNNLSRFYSIIGPIHRSEIINLGKINHYSEFFFTFSLLFSRENIFPTLRGSPYDTWSKANGLFLKNVFQQISTKKCASKKKFQTDIKKFVQRPRCQF